MTGRNGSRRRGRPFRRRDDGSMAVEVVLMAPVLVIFMLFVVALGRMVWVKGELESATRDAVRAGVAGAGRRARRELAAQEIAAEQHGRERRLRGGRAVAGTSRPAGRSRSR